MLFEELSGAAGAEVAKLEEELAGKVMGIDATVVAIQSRLAGAGFSNLGAAMDTAAPAVNATLAELIPLVRAALAGAVLDLRKLERWIVLNVPKVEDGNNFGVAIQIDVHKMVLEHRKELKAMLDKLADYHKERAALLKEVVSAKTSSDTTETATKNDDSEAKGADASVATVKAGKSTKTETRTARSTPLPDACEAVVALDVMWYFHLGYVLEVARDAYIATGDMVQKNKLKLEQPKGDGNSRMNMF